MAQPPPDADSSRGVPGWLKIIGIGLIIVVLLVVALMLISGGGGHTPPPGAH